MTAVTSAAEHEGFTSSSESGGSDSDSDNDSGRELDSGGSNDEAEGGSASQSLSSEPRRAESSLQLDPKWDEFSSSDQDPDDEGALSQHFSSDDSSDDGFSE